MLAAAAGAAILADTIPRCDCEASEPQEWQNTVTFERGGEQERKAKSPGDCAFRRVGVAAGPF